jgi:hypothetical protein
MLKSNILWKIETHILCSETFCRKSCVCEIIWKNAVEPVRPYDNIRRRMRFACWITKATDTHSESVILIAFSRQQWLNERASVLCDTILSVLSVYCLPCLYIEYCYNSESVSVPILLLPVLWNLQLRPWDNLQNIYLYYRLPKHHISSINVITVDHTFLKYED